eukprot:scaffold4097_cov306-Pinguiococcus_pyrenoidosus.AAC.21
MQLRRMRRADAETPQVEAEADVSMLQSVLELQGFDVLDMKDRKKYRSLGAQRCTVAPVPSSGGAAGEGQRGHGARRAEVGHAGRGQAASGDQDEGEFPWCVCSARIVVAAVRFCSQRPHEVLNQAWSS